MSYEESTGRGGIGRRARLKIEFLDRSASSSLAAPTLNPADLKGRSIPERYLAGLPKAVQKARVRELTRSRDAYGKGDYSELPSDHIARQMGLVKKSAYSEVAEARGIEWRGDEAEMARRVCAHYKVKCTPAIATAIRSSFNKGLAAWKSGGHRPGATAQNWAVARVASLVVGGKTSLTADQKGFASFPAPLQKAIAAGRREVAKALLAQGRENDAAVVGGVLRTNPGTDALMAAVAEWARRYKSRKKV